MYPPSTRLARKRRPNWTPRLRCKLYEAPPADDGNRFGGGGGASGSDDEDSDPDSDPDAPA